MKSYLFFLAVIFVSTSMVAQVAINSDNNAPDPSAMLDVRSSDKGMLIPRLSLSQVQTIANPADGLLVYCTADSKIYTYIASLGLWKEVAYGPGTIAGSFSCGNPITITHVAGTVAPVNKTATYGTVSISYTGSNKCWITSNLGADHQASAVNDNTEPSAGWYWQFNYKQGFKHDGSAVTPAWTITSIDDNSDWLIVNDPCNIELGNAWHIPTYTEWFNVDNTGGWSDWSGPWNSVLKLHAAGFLSDNNGSLNLRGLNGDNWSSTMFNPTHGWYLDFNSSYCFMNNYGKAFGFSLRCLRDN